MGTAAELSLADGGTNGNAYVGTPGAGAPVYGQDGGDAVPTSGTVYAYGSGGGGGSRGEHGQGFYLKVAGNISGTGSIDVRGQPGGAGGRGGQAYSYYNSPVGGGGGGGGAGGSGGRIVIRVHGSSTDPTGLSIHLLTRGADGGASGPGGDPGYGHGGFAGAPGAAGSDGSIDSKAYGLLP
jgi:hypothetical protein